MERGAPAPEGGALDVVAGPSLLTALVDGFEQNEIVDGWHPRTCPFASDDAARVAFRLWAMEITRWLGEGRAIGDRAVEWPKQLRMKRDGPCVGIWIRADFDFRERWHSRAMWQGGRCDGAMEWEDELPAAER